MSTQVCGGARRLLVAVAAALAPAGLMLLALAGGCSKHEWLSQKRAGLEPVLTAGFDSTGRPLPTRPVAATSQSRRVQPATDARPQSGPPPENPAVMGAMAAPAPEDAVTELRWEPIAPAGGGGVGAAASGAAGRAAGCSAGPCYWIQVAALADSSGATAALASAVALASRAGEAPTAPGGSVLREAGLWKVRLGPWERWEDAEAALRAVRTGGFGAAWLVRQGGNSG